MGFRVFIIELINECPSSLQEEEVRSWTRAKLEEEFTVIWRAFHGACNARDELLDLYMDMRDQYSQNLPFEDSMWPTVTRSNN